MEFVDRDHFGPLYRFLHTHQVLDQGGKVVGYQHLGSVRRSLEGIMIRRKKEDVLKQLPDRVEKHFFVPMTREQREIHDENYDIVVRLVAKWRRYKFLSEADQRRMQIALSMMRMAADNTYLVDKKTVHGPKLEELAVLLRELIIEGGEKVVIFSQWLRMTELVERVLAENGIAYVHLNGMVPSKDRKELMTRFREDRACMVFLSTDAGGVGLNLQSGSVVINMDIPWNPAILEQRIGRVHRLGQRRQVRVVNFVTKASIEERILDLLRFKNSLFAGALDEGRRRRDDRRKSDQKVYADARSRDGWSGKSRSPCRNAGASRSWPGYGGIGPEGKRGRGNRGSNKVFWRRRDRMRRGRFLDPDIHERRRIPDEPRSCPLPRYRISPGSHGKSDAGHDRQR
jgi:SNF2 family DNA or RNA helicase